VSGAHSKPDIEKPKKSAFKRVLEWGVVIVVALVISAGIRGIAFQAFFVPSGSMIPTLNIGDRMLVDKLFFSASSVGRGAIVVLHHPSHDSMCGPPGEDLVKRVIATAGQTIWSKGNTIYIDGKAITESYLPRGTLLGTTPISRQTIPKGDVYLLGDNRSISCDSRFWGPIPTSSIVGKVVAIFWRSGHPYLHFF